MIVFIVRIFCRPCPNVVDGAIELSWINRNRDIIVYACQHLNASSYPLPPKNKLVHCSRLITSTQLQVAWFISRRPSCLYLYITALSSAPLLGLLTFQLSHFGQASSVSLESAALQVRKCTTVEKNTTRLRRCSDKNAPGYTQGN